MPSVLAGFTSPSTSTSSVASKFMNTRMKDLGLLGLGSPPLPLVSLINTESHCCCSDFFPYGPCFNDSFSRSHQYLDGSSRMA